MKYRIKAFLLEDNNILSCRFECVLSSFDDVCEFLSRVSLNAYDVVKVIPDGFSEV